MPAFHHGITAQEVTQGILPMRSANVSVIGLVATSSDADDSIYPPDTPVLLTGITQDNIAKAGTDGTLANCLQSIRDIYNPTVVVLRVSDPDNVDALDVLLTCQSRLGVTPKRLGAPEIDTPEVVLKLVSIAKRRRAIVYASPRKESGDLITDKTGIAAYRDTFGDRELCLIENEWGIKGKSNGVDNSNDKTDFTTLPVNNSVVINNSDGSFNNQTLDFSIEVNGTMYNADKSQELTGLIASDLYDQVSIYRSSDGNINFTPVVAGPLEIRLSPSDSQKVYSNTYLSGTGVIEKDGTFAFKLGTV